MKTRMHLSIEVGDREKLSEIAKDFSKKLDPGTKMTLMDALSDPHCLYGEGGEKELFLWGIIGEVYPYTMFRELNDLGFWKELFLSGAILENSHILVIWQSSIDESASAMDIYCLREGLVSIVVEKLPIDLVIYER